MPCGDVGQNIILSNVCQVGKLQKVQMAYDLELGGLQILGSSNFGKRK